MEDAEGQRGEVFCGHIIDQLLLGVFAHVYEKDRTGREASVEEKLKCAHLRVPCPEKLARNQIIGRKDRIHDEVKDGPFWVIWRQFALPVNFDIVRISHCRRRGIF